MCQESASQLLDEEPKRAMAGTQPLLCEKAFVQRLPMVCEAACRNSGWRDQQVDLAPLFAAQSRKHKINLCLMEKAALRKVAQQGEEERKRQPCFQICQAHLENSNCRCLRQFEGEEGAGDEGRKGTNERKPPDSYSEANRWTGISYRSVDSSLLNLKE